MSNQQGAKITVYWYVARECSLAMAEGYDPPYFHFAKNTRA